MRSQDEDCLTGAVAGETSGPSGFLGRHSQASGGAKAVIGPPTTSSSQMIFGKRPPEARGNRNKILSAGGSNNTFYKSALLGSNSGSNRVGVDGGSINKQEFLSPRPINNNGVGELKTSQGN